MKKKLAAILLSCTMALSTSTFAFAQEASPAIATEDVIASAGITVDDLEDVAFYYKEISQKGTENEYEKEFKFASAAAALGSCEAMLWLGEMYQGNKIDAAKDTDAIAAAIDWWKLAAENGQPRGYTNIGLLYMHNTIPGGGSEYGDIPYDPETALEYYQMASDLGDFKAPRYIGLCYQDGIGVAADEQKAFENFLLASERGDSTASVYCADYLLEGKGVEQDADRAIAMYQEMVDTNGHDITKCAYALAKIYEEGVYAEADEEKAKEYYQIVVDTSSSTDSEEVQDAIAALAK